MGVLNALMMLEVSESDSTGTIVDTTTPAPSAAEVQEERARLIQVARQNAQRLNRALVTLLDLASLESGNFHVSLKELDLVRLLQSRLAANATFLNDHGIQFQVHKESGPPVLGDPQRLGRAVDLCLETLAPRLDPAYPPQIKIGASRVIFQVKLKPEAARQWAGAWLQAQVGFQSGVATSASVFAGVMQSEEAFLARTEEGLGSELLLIHEILRIHHGRFYTAQEMDAFQLILELPALSSDAGIRAVLASRAYAISTELRSVGVVLIEVPAGIDPKQFALDVRRSLFRSSDAVYALPESQQVSLVLDDCKPEDIPGLMERIQKNLGRRIRFGVSHCPSDGLDPSELLGLAEKRIKTQGAQI